MPDALSILRQNVAVICVKRGSKTEKAKAVASITGNLSVRTTIAALSENSMTELCIGPPTEQMQEEGFMSWSGIAVEVILSMANMCDDALNAKTKKTTVRTEYIDCIRKLFKLALAHGPCGSLRGIVPPFLAYSYQWLSEPGLRDALAHDIWQTTRDLLQVEENRAMLSAGYLKKWTDICFQQITGRGPVVHKLKMTTNLAQEVLVLMAEPVSTYDVLTQSQKGVHPSELKGTDFGYTLLLERCCFLFVLAKSMKDRDERQLQATALKCIGVILERHSLDMIGSAAALSVLELSIPAVLACWVERSYHDCATAAAKGLVRLANSNKPSSLHPIRERIERDFGREDGAASIVRSFEDLKNNDNEVEVAGNIFSVEEVVAKIKTAGMSPVHRSAWLRILCYLLSFRSNAINLSVVSVGAMSYLLSGKSGHRKLEVELLRYICDVIKAATESVLSASKKIGVSDLRVQPVLDECREAWSTAYSFLLQQLMYLTHANSYRASRSATEGSSTAQLSMMQCITCVLQSGFVDSSQINSSSWHAVLPDGSRVLSDEAVEFARVHLSQAGLRIDDGRNFRVNLASMLISFCKPMEEENPNCTSLKHCVSGVLALSRGVCQSDVSAVDALSVWKENDCSGFDSIDAFVSHFGVCDIRDESSAKSFVESAKMSSFSSGMEVSSNLYQMPNFLSPVGKNEKPVRVSSRFTVDHTSRGIIEKNLVEQIVQFLDSSFANSPEEDTMDSLHEVSNVADFAEHLSGRLPGLSKAELEDSHCVVLHVAFLIAEYLEQGSSTGSIALEELEGQDSNPISLLRYLLFFLLTKIAATSRFVFQGHAETLSSLISSCSALYSISKESRGARAPSRGAKGAAENNGTTNNSTASFGNLLSQLVGNVCGMMGSCFEDETLRLVEKIKAMLAPNSSGRGTKRRIQESQRGSKSQRRSPRISKRRKRESSWSDDSDQDDFPDEASRQSDSDRDGNGPEGSTSPLFRKNTRPRDSAESACADMTEFAMVLGQASRTLPQLSAIVLEQCKACLQTASKLETRLSPDGPSRSLIASRILDSDYFRGRMCLWEILLSLQDGFIDVGNDIAHIGKKWEVLEDLSFNVASCYANELLSSKRKNYPPLKENEFLRRSFLYYSARLLLRSCPLPSSTALRARGSPNASLSPKVMGELVDIAEMFRSRDGLRMPRKTRIAYLHFGALLLNNAYSASTSLSPTSQENAPLDPGLTKPYNFIRKAVCRLLSDCDATVRMSAAGFFHKFLRISRSLDILAMEELLCDSLPKIDMCRERTSAWASEVEMEMENDAGDEDDFKDLSQNWNLNRREEDDLKCIMQRFKDSGASAKSISTHVALGEVAIHRSDLLPFCLFDMVRRVAEDKTCENIAFNAIVRLCAHRGIPGPEQLFAIAKRLLLPKWFSTFDEPSALSKFPARLFFDLDRFRHGIVYDWMRIHIADILPFVLLTDVDSRVLTNSIEFSRKLGEPLEKLLSSNVGSFARICPMVSTGGLDHKGHKLWDAINTVLQNQASCLISNNRDSVNIALLMSISTGVLPAMGPMTTSPMDASQPMIPFLRDCREVQPPLYDPFIVAAALESLHTSDDTSRPVYSRSELCGSLLSDSCNFSTASTAFSKKPGTYIRMLLATWKMFSGPPGPVHPRNRVDALFIVATLWKIAGVNLLLESNRRRLLLHLILEGFKYPETALHALCLLQHVAKRSGDIPEKHRVSLKEIFMDDELASDLDALASSQERRCFEVLSVSFPLLVEVSLGDYSTSISPLCQRAAIDGLIFLADWASSKEMWAPLGSVEIVPGVKDLKQVKRAQENAMEKSFSKTIENHKASISKSMARFIISERRVSRGRRQLPLTLSSLTRLRKALSEENRSHLVFMIQEEAWLRTEGRPETTLGLLNEILGFLVDINHDVTAVHSRQVRLTSADGTRGQETSSKSTYERILQECAWLIGVLGSIYPTSVIFESGRRRRQQRLDSLQCRGRYESVDDGIVKALPLLRECILGDSPVVAKSAFISLVALLATPKGKELFAARKEDFKPLTEFRAIARKMSLAGDQQAESELPEFPDVTDSSIWICPKADGTSSRLEDQWLMYLAATLASNSTNDAIHALCSICFVSVEFARSLFPYVLLDAVSNTGDQERASLSANIDNHILKDSTIPFDAVRVIIHGLDFLCQLRQNVLFEKGVGTFFKPKSKEGFPFLYLLDIPYLSVAEAASRVGMHFSAVRYASLYVDHECILDERETLQSLGRSGNRGTRRLSSKTSTPSTAPIARDRARKAAEHILFASAGSINEPDMIRGLGQQDDLLETAANMAVLDSDWERSAGVLDSLCHKETAKRTGTANLHRQLSEGSACAIDSDVADLGRELMFLKSLNGMGCTNLVSHYSNIVKDKMDSRGEKMGSEDHAEQLNEQRFAAAWKLGDWESPEPVRTSSSIGHVEPVFGVQQAIYQGLSFLRSGDLNSVLGTIQQGRKAQVEWLGKMDASESAQRLYQVAERVRVLNIFESVVKLLNAFGLSNESGSMSVELGSARGSTALDDGRVNLRERVHGFKDAFMKLLETDAGPNRVQGSVAGDDFELDLHVAVARCLRRREIVAGTSSTVAARLFAKGGSGAWSRAAAALGSERLAALDEASAIDVAAWRLQEVKLRWAASEDGRMKQSALSQVKVLIEEDLGGVLKEKESKIPDTFHIQWMPFPGDQNTIASVRAEACQLVASWSATMRAEDPMTLYRSYLKMSLEAFDGSENPKQRGISHYFMAEFADAQLTSIDNYRKTKNYDHLVLSIKETEERIKSFEKLDPRNLGKSGASSGGKRGRASRGQASNVPTAMGTDLKKLILDLKRRLKQDQDRLEEMDEKYQEWQRLACIRYASSLCDGSQNDLRGSFRLVALWLDSGTMREYITEELTEGNDKGNMCLKFPLAKLLPLAPQLCSRLGASNDIHFQNTLSATLEHMAIEFPSHCLWQLLSLSNSTRVAANAERCASFYVGDKDKKEAAERILARVEAAGSAMIAQMKSLADAYIELSEARIEKNDTRLYLDITGSALLKSKKYADVPVPTTGLPMYGSKDFSPPCVYEFQARARICNGLSKPLKVVCIGSDGHKYPQMIKGKDDLRGDAVMEQMFTILNELLRRNPAAARRNLLVRTYRVVPLSPFSGIMQFVDNTSQFKELLVTDHPTGAGDRKALHDRYRPHDMRQWDMRNNVFKAMALSKAKAVRYLTENWDNFQPVFRYFFLEQWPDPVDWYSRQLAYSRSVAVMSIVGFILGIGDRHLANILVDTVSGEAVHIDFGIAFEFGKLLPTPELMPFRLTRDIVDGLGVNGVDGTFRHCCEVTLQIMRENKDVLLTIIEVLLHDPMYNWGLTPEEVLMEQLQGDEKQMKLMESLLPREKNEENEGSKEAQRALRRIAEKLDGLEDTERLSVEAHVARLIDEARAIKVLVSVFPGWAPW